LIELAFVIYLFCTFHLLLSYDSRVFAFEIMLSIACSRLCALDCRTLESLLSPSGRNCEYIGIAAASRDCLVFDTTCNLVAWRRGPGTESEKKKETEEEKEGKERKGDKGGKEEAGDRE
jgi:hypothetical protein